MNHDNGFPLTKQMRATYSLFWDYCFTEEGILRIKIISVASLVAIVAVAATVVYVATFLVFSSWGGVLVLLVVVLPLGASLGFGFLLPIRRRNIISNLPVEELAGRSSIQTIPWSEVDQIKYRNAVIDIRSKGRRYRAFVSRTDEAGVLGLIRSKIDGKLKT